MDNEKNHLSRPLIVLCLALLLSAPHMAQQRTEIPPEPQFVKIPPETAASHLLKKGVPVYPAFAKAAGIDGVMHVGIGIYPDGRVHAIQEISGWACLREAATKAAAQYVYKPFEKNGHPVVAETTVDIVFRLPDYGKIFHPLPPPELTLDSFTQFGDADSATDAHTKLRKWIVSHLQKNFDDMGSGDSGSLSAQGISQDKRTEILAATRVIEIPTKNPADHLYVVSPRVGCGATGNCDIYMVEDNARGVRLVADTGGWGFYAYPHQGSPFPDIFFVSHMSAGEVDVDGFSNAGGEWGLLYCGKIVLGEQEEDDVHLCR